jgi:hypothetical protein
MFSARVVPLGEREFGVVHASFVEIDLHMVSTASSLIAAETSLGVVGAIVEFQRNASFGVGAACPQGRHRRVRFSA